MFSVTLSRSLVSPKVELSGDSGNKYNFHSPQPRARHTVRMRAADSRWHQWGAWSPPAEFGRYPPRRPGGGPSRPHLTSEPTQAPEELLCGEDLCTLPSRPLMKDRAPTLFHPHRKGRTHRLPPVPTPPGSTASWPHLTGPSSVSGLDTGHIKRGPVSSDRDILGTGNHPGPWLPAANFYNLASI